MQHGYILGMVLSAAATSFVASGAAAAATATRVAVGAKYVFAPIGFDDNDEAEVVLDGYLPDGCYRIDPPQIVIDQAAALVTITPMARFYGGTSCIKSLVPYSQVVELGVLARGRYTVAIGDGFLQEVLDVRKATSVGPDDFLYAPVDTVSTGMNAATGGLEATLTGRFTNSCMVWDDVRVIDTGKVINVLPIMKLQGATCQAGEFPYTLTVPLPDSVTVARHLLHVRSLNGQAVNYLFYKNSPQPDE